MEKIFMSDFAGRLESLKQDIGLELVEHTVSALGEVSRSTEAAVLNRWSLPEEAILFRYTITPSTMLIGYQGYNVLPIQRQIYELRQSLFPSLSSVYTKPAPSQATVPTRKRIGFISSWFRSHSVGKLLVGVVEQLDRSQFEIIIYRCIHFLRDRDEMTRKFEDMADIYVELPTDQKNAVEKLRQDELDVAVFPELGMDAWTVFLSHHRLAPIQAVFWGHPITTGNSNIDFSISSRYFVSENRDEGRQPGTSNFRILKQEPEKRTSSEQIVLFNGLSTIFTKPTDFNRTAFDKADQISREKLHLPQNRHVYVCPQVRRIPIGTSKYRTRSRRLRGFDGLCQTLMKLNPRFDAALEGILDRDPKALIVLLASDTQKIWTEQLRRRFRLRLRQVQRKRFRHCCRS